MDNIRVYIAVHVPEGVIRYYNRCIVGILLFLDGNEWTSRANIEEVIVLNEDFCSTQLVEWDQVMLLEVRVIRNVLGKDVLARIRVNVGKNVCAVGEMVIFHASEMLGWVKDFVTFEDKGAIVVIIKEIGYKTDVLHAFLGHSD